MAFFKFRKGGDDVAANSAPPESVEGMRKRARHRLMGAALLVLVGVVGFPMLFETQPRPSVSDVSIEIPDKAKVKPLVAAPAAVAPASASSAVVVAPEASVTAAPVAVAPAPVMPNVVAPASPAPAASRAASVPASASLGAREEVVPPKPESKPATPPPAASSPPAKASAPAPRASASADDGARARALLEGKDAVPTAAASGAGGQPRFVVQVGAFADAAKAREARKTLEKSSYKTYEQVVDTKDGKRTRVRAGPFATRDEADKAAAKIKALGLHAAVLTL